MNPFDHYFAIGQPSSAYEIEYPLDLRRLCSSHGQSYRPTYGTCACVHVCCYLRLSRRAHTHNITNERDRCAENGWSLRAAVLCGPAGRATIASEIEKRGFSLCCGPPSAMHQNAAEPCAWKWMANSPNFSTSAGGRRRRHRHHHQQAQDRARRQKWHPGNFSGARHSESAHALAHYFN